MKIISQLPPVAPLVLAALLGVVAVSVGCEVDDDDSADADTTRDLPEDLPEEDTSTPPTLEPSSDPVGDNNKQSDLDNTTDSMCSELENSDEASDIEEFVTADRLSPTEAAALVGADTAAGETITDAADCNAANVQCNGSDDAILSSSRLIVGKMKKVAEVPTDDSNCRFEALVMETDGDTANDWEPQGDFGCDYYQGTDTWIQKDKDASGNVSMSVQKVSTAQVAEPADLIYRIVEDGAETWFVIDGSDFTSPLVSARLVTFNDPSCSFDFDELHGDVSGDSPLDPLPLASTIE